MTFKTQTKTLTPALLEEQLEDFLTRELPRRETLYDYYQGAQPVRKGPAVPGRPNNLLSANYAKYRSEEHTSELQSATSTPAISWGWPPPSPLRASASRIT